MCIISSVSHMKNHAEHMGSSVRPINVDWIKKEIETDVATSTVAASSLSTSSITVSKNIPFSPSVLPSSKDLAIQPLTFKNQQATSRPNTRSFSRLKNTPEPASAEISGKDFVLIGSVKVKQLSLSEEPLGGRASDLIESPGTGAKRSKTVNQSPVLFPPDVDTSYKKDMCSSMSSNTSSTDSTLPEGQLPPKRMRHSASFVDESEKLTPQSMGKNPQTVREIRGNEGGNVVCVTDGSGKEEGGVEDVDDDEPARGGPRVFGKTLETEDVAVMKSRKRKRLCQLVAREEEAQGLSHFYLSIMMYFSFICTLKSGLYVSIYTHSLTHSSHSLLSHSLLYHLVFFYYE